MEEKKTVKRRANISDKTLKLAQIGILVAIAADLLILRIPIIPTAPFLEYSPSDVPILIGTFAFGPIAGIAITLIVASIQGIIFSPQSGVYGVIMHCIATGTLIIVAGTIYKISKTRKMAAIAMICGTLAMTLVMVFANFVVTPLFLGVPVEVVKSMIFPAIVPFNLIKGVVNSILVFLLYKRISKVFRSNNW